MPINSYEFICKTLCIFGCLFFCSSIQVAYADLNEQRTQSTPASTFDLLGLPPIIDSDAIKQKLEEITTALKNRNLAECEQRIDELKSLDPTLPAKQVMIARLLMQTGNLGDAIARIEQHLITTPNDPAAFVTLADIAIRTQRWTEAALLAEKADTLLDADTTSNAAMKSNLKFELLGRRADSAYQRQQFDVALEALEKRRSIRPADSTTLRVIGLIKIEQGDLNAALELLQQAKKLEPNLQQPELMIALTLSAKNDGDAEAWYRKGIQALDVTTDNWSKYFHWLLLQNRALDLISYHGKMPEATRASRDVKFLRGLAARYENDLELAESIFSQLHQANPEDLEAADQLAQVLVESSDEGKRGRAAQLSEANLRRAPNIENTVATAAWVQYKLGAIDVADRLLGELTSKLAISPQTAFYVSEVLRARGKSEEADQVLEAAMKQPGIFVQRNMK